MDDDNNKGTGILGLGGTPVSNRDADDRAYPERGHERLRDTDILRDSDIVRDRDAVTDAEAIRDRGRIRDNEEATREGAGILGLGGTAVPKSPLDPSASDDLDSAQRRRERMLESEETDRQTATDRHAGAAGIDMGSGGEGTDVSGR